MPSPSPSPRSRPGIVLALLLCLLLPAPALADPAPALADPAPAPGPSPTGEWLVTQAEAADLGGILAQRASGIVAATPVAGRVTRVTASPTVAARLAARADVVAVEPDREREWHRAPDDASYALQWSHQVTGVEQAWDVTTGGGLEGESRPLVAVLDSGVDATHPDLAGTVVASLRAADGQVVTGEARNDDCGIGHGTLVAGVVGAQGDNAIGVSGVLWRPRIIDVALTSPLNDCPGGPRDSDAIAALHHIAGLEEPPLVANLSFGANEDACGAAYQAAVDEARAAGIVVVSSAGNGASTRTSVPASCNGVISVGAVGPTLEPATYAQHNAYLDLTGPGGQLLSCPDSLAQLSQEAVLSTSLNPTTEYAFAVSCTRELSDPNGHRLEARQGTSFSTPYVAGVIALVRQRAADLGRPLDPDQAEAVVEHSARDLGPAGRDVDNGWGLVDAAAAMAAVEEDRIPPLEPDPDFPVAGGGAPPLRVADGADLDVTDPIAQAVATSALLPTGSAPVAVLARVDDFADALAGSALGRGIGPVLFTPSTGPLAGATRAELQRVLDRSGTAPTVYVMGGTAAVPAGVEQELEALGADVVRIAGAGREATAALASQAVEAMDAGLDADVPRRDDAFLVSGRDFADAVSAGQMAARYGIPVLVTNTDALHPEAAAELRRLGPERLWVVGGTAAISDATMAEAATIVSETRRLGGATRIQTALAVWQQYAAELAEDGAEDLGAARTVAVNLRDSATDALAATLLAGGGDWFMPLEGAGGTPLGPDVREAFCGQHGELVVVGGHDRVSDQVAAQAIDVLAGVGC